MTDRTSTTAALVCTHEVIQTWGDGTTAVMWACADPDCRLRFYPACRECVDIGHRTIVHEARAEPRAEGLDVERLARAMATESVRRWVMEAWVDSGVSEPGYATPDEMAAAIAREYSTEVQP